MEIRPATLADAPALLELYAPYVRETAISFELEVPTVEEFRERVRAKLGKFPWLVAEEHGALLGYAYAGPFHTRAAYAWSVESSVYVRKGSHGRGVGSALYEALLAKLRAQGFVNVIGGLTLPNEASRRLHERFGFVKCAHYTNAGFKLGRWWDVAYWQLQLVKPGVDERPADLRATELR